MNERKKPLVVLGVQGRTLQDQPRSQASKSAGSKKSEEFPLWYVCTIVVLVAGLSYLLVPSIRERTHERLAVLSGTQPKSTPVATGAASSGAVLPAAGAPLSAAATAAPAAPASQAAAAEAYFAASMARQPPAGPGQGAKAATPAGGRDSSAPQSPVPAVAPKPARSEAPASRDSSAQPASSRRNPPVLVRGKRVSDPAEENVSVVSKPLVELTPPAQENSSTRSDEAYKILLDKVPGMAAIAAKSDPALQLKSWSLVKAEESELWIDLVAIRSADKQEEHFIWKIRLDEQTVFPLNQSARRMAVK